MLKDKVYDWLKWFAIVGLHALGVAYGQLANIWGLPYSQAIPETLDIIGVLLGCFLAWENYQYKQSYDVFTAPKLQLDDATDIDLEDCVLDAEVPAGDTYSAGGEE